MANNCGYKYCKDMGTKCYLWCPRYGYMKGIKAIPQPDYAFYEKAFDGYAKEQIKLVKVPCNQISTLLDQITLMFNEKLIDVSTPKRTQNDRYYSAYTQLALSAIKANEPILQHIKSIRREKKVIE